MKPAWYFRTMEANEINQNPVQGEFFNPELLKSAAASLVRESYQNTMDAVLKDEMARIRVFFSGDKFAIKPEIYECFFDGLPKHLSAKDSGLIEPPDADQKMDFIGMYTTIYSWNGVGIIRKGLHSSRRISPHKK